MVSLESCKSIALSFPETVEQPHFEKISVRINKKIFITLDSKKQIATVKLTAKSQDLFSLFDPKIVYPVPNKWGLQGWTIVELNLIDLDFLKEIIEEAFQTVSKSK
jgi:hypothetical protein